MNYGRTLASATPLPFTGLALGWWVTAAMTMLFVGIALWQLARKPNETRP